MNRSIVQAVFTSDASNRASSMSHGTSGATGLRVVQLVLYCLRLVLTNCAASIYQWCNQSCQQQVTWHKYWRQNYNVWWFLQSQPSFSMWSKVSLPLIWSCRYPRPPTATQDFSHNLPVLTCCSQRQHGCELSYFIVRLGLHMKMLYTVINKTLL